MEAGQIVAGRYRLRRSVGHAATLWHAEDLELGRDVALKVLRVTSGAGVERFLREAAILSKLRDPHVVGYLGQGITDDNHLYLVMEWLEGEDLERYSRRRRLTLEQILGVARGVAQGLDALHQLGVVHRDLKPSNLLVTRGDPSRVVVLDLGLAREPSEEPLTASGAMLGSVGFMAPEQIVASSSIDARADLYALGCVLFQLLTGEPPHAGQRGVAALERTARVAAPSLAERAPQTPEALVRLVDGLLRHDPEERIASAALLLQQLSALSLAATGEHLPSERLHVPPAPVGGSRVLLAARLGAAPAEAGVVPSPHELRRLGARCVALEAEFTLFDVAAEAPLEEQLTAGHELALMLSAAAPALRLALVTSLAHELEHAERHARRLLALEATGLALCEVSRSLLAVVAGQPAPVGAALGLVAPLMGRDRECQYVLASYEQVRSEAEPFMIVLGGRLGAGKSRLLTELCVRLRSRGARVLSAPGQASQRRSAYAWRRALLAALGQPEGTASVGEPSDLQALRGLTEHAQEPAPLVLLVDRLEWVDPWSVAWLEQLLRAEAPCPVLVVGALSDAGRTLHAGLLAQRGVQELRLGPLGVGAATRLARALLGEAADESALTWVVSQARGLPLALELLAPSASARWVPSAATLLFSLEPGSPR